MHTNLRIFERQVMRFLTEAKSSRWTYFDGKTGHLYMSFFHCHRSLVAAADIRPSGEAWFILRLHSTFCSAFRALSDEGQDSGNRLHDYGIQGRRHDSSVHKGIGTKEKITPDYFSITKLQKPQSKLYIG